MDREVDTSTVQTAHAQVPLNQLHNQPQTNQPSPPTQGFEQDPANGRIVRGGPQETNKFDTAGRPSKYDPSLCEALIEYFNVEPNREVIITQRFGKDNITETPKELPNDLPTLEGWCQKTGIHPSTVSEWVKQYPEFSEAITRAKAYQYHILVSNGLKGLYDARFAMFIATNLTKLKNKSITEETGERKVIVEHRNYGRSDIIDAETVDSANTIPVRA